MSKNCLLREHVCRYKITLHPSSMGKCYCDYCDVFLTNDSVAVRKQHNEGNRHKYNVCEYYRQYVGQQLQQQIDDIVAQFELDVARGILRPSYGLPPPPKTTTDSLPSASASAEAPNLSSDGPPADAQSPDSKSDVIAATNTKSKPDGEPAVKLESGLKESENSNADASDPLVDGSKHTKEKDVPALHDPVSVNMATETDETKTSTAPTVVETHTREN